MEQWRDIKGCEDSYSISSLGRVKSKSRFVKSCWGSIKPIHERILKPSLARGVLHVILRIKGENITARIHRLVAEAFIPNPYSLPQVDHKNRNSIDNVVGNLRWCSVKQNAWNTGQRTHKYIGVYPYHSRINPWRAYCSGRWLGAFKTKRGAAIAYNNFVRDNHGQFAVLNVL